MNLLFLMPDWAIASEPWMMRMLEMTRPNLVAIGCNRPPTGHWHNVPIYTMDWQPRPWHQRIKAKLTGNPASNTWLSPDQQLQRIIQRHDIDCILIHFANNALIYRNTFNQRPDIPVFVHCHGLDVTWDLRHYQPPHDPVFEPDYQQQICQLPEHVQFIANSKATCNILTHAGIHANRVHLKYLSTPIPDKTPAMPPLDHQRGLQLLYVGRLVDFKGPIQTIQACDLAITQGTCCQLTVIGDGPLMQACADAIADTRTPERFHMLGELDNAKVYQRFALSHVVTAHNQPGPISRQTEAFGVFAIEAMAHARPVITGDSGGVGETVIDLQTGLLFAPGDLQAHARAIHTLANDFQRCTAMGRAAREHAKTHFAPAQEQARLTAILNLSNPAKGGAET